MRVATWNMQGANFSSANKWNYGVRQLANHVRVLCLQECGKVPPSAQLVQPAVDGDPLCSLYAWYGAQLLHYNWDVAGGRVNLAVITDSGNARPGVLHVVSGNEWRPIIGFKMAGALYLTIHAISPGGADVPRMLEAAAGASEDADSRWQVAGDFNREPDSLADVPCRVCPPHTFTYKVVHPIKRYDYMVRGENEPSVGGFVMLQLRMSDHYPVVFDV